MSKENERVYTTEQAMHRLNMSRATFFSRLKEHPEIQPTNYNPNLKRRHNPTWREEDLNKLGTPINIDEDESVKNIA